MALQAYICHDSGNTSWLVPRRILGFRADPIIFVVPVVHVLSSLFLEGYWVFCGNKMRHVYVCMQIVVDLLVLVLLG